MFDMGLWMIAIAGGPLIVLLILMYVFARRRSRGKAQRRDVPRPDAGSNREP